MNGKFMAHLGWWLGLVVGLRGKDAGWLRRTKILRVDVNQKTVVGLRFNTWHSRLEVLQSVYLGFLGMVRSGLGK